jgi:hypothetical protein
MKLSKWVRNETSTGAIMHQVYSGQLAAAIWESTPLNPMTQRGRIQRYEIYLNRRGHKCKILNVSVTDHTVTCEDIRTLCEYLMLCFENRLETGYVGVYGDSEFYREILPEPSEGVLLAGVRLGRLYEHRDGGLYKVNAVTNIGCADQEKWPETVVYRDAVTGQMFSRPVMEFLDETRYKLFAHGQMFDYQHYLQKRKARSEDDDMLAAIHAFASVYQKSEVYGTSNQGEVRDND